MCVCGVGCVDVIYCVCGVYAWLVCDVLYVCGTYVLQECVMYWCDMLYVCVCHVLVRIMSLCV